MLCARHQALEGVSTEACVLGLCCRGCAGRDECGQERCGSTLRPTLISASATGPIGQHLTAVQVFTQPFQDGTSLPHASIDENIEVLKGEVTSPGTTASNWENLVLAFQGVCLRGHLYPEMERRHPLHPSSCRLLERPAPDLCRLQLSGFQTECCLSSGGGELSMQFPLPYDQGG